MGWGGGGDGVGRPLRLSERGLGGRRFWVSLGAICKPQGVAEGEGFHCE